MKKLFHSIVYKLLYVLLCGRRDIQLATIFLASRLKDTRKDNYAKLRRLLYYLKGTIDKTVFIGTDDLNIIITPVNVSYATHDDFKSHTGGVLSFGIRLISSKSSKQKLNMTSSTEAEIVGVTDCLPKVLSYKLFMEEQGYSLRTNIIL